MSKKDIDIDMKNLSESDALTGMNDKQKRIIEASQRLFGERGFAQTATADIAKEAGVTERTLFKHFSSKAELFKQILIPILLRFVAPSQFKEIRALTEVEYDNYEDFLLALFRNRAKALRTHGGQVTILLQQILTNEQFRAQFAEIFLQHILKPMKSMILRMQKEGKIRPDIHADVIVRTQIATIFSYFFVRLVFGAKTPELDEETELKQMASALSIGLAVQS